MKRLRIGLLCLVLIGALAALFSAVVPAAQADPAPQWLAATLQGTFVGSASPTECDQLGTAVAVSGDTALVGSQYYQASGQVPAAYHRGQVYVYVRSNDAWAQQAVLVASDPEDADQFGCSVAIDGERRSSALSARVAPAPSTSSPAPARRGRRRPSWPDRRLPTPAGRWRSRAAPCSSVRPPARAMTVRSCAERRSSTRAPTIRGPCSRS